MWIVTRVGFFSIVQKPEDRATNQLTVRARVEGDLRALQSRYLPELGEIQTSSQNDYRYRARASKEVVEAALARIATDIDYSNFKNVVAKEQGHDRAHVYSDVWHALYPLQAS